MTLRLEERNFRAFFECPFQIYGPDSLYVSPLQSDLARFLDDQDNPLFRDFGRFSYFTAHDARGVRGRIVAHVHTASNQLHSLNRAYFGFFDCADDPAAARALLNAAEDWGRGQGCTEIAGNFNLTAMQQIGVMTEGFDHAPYIDQVYSPPYLPSLLETNGYAREFPMSTWELDLGSCDPGALLNDQAWQLQASGRVRFERVRPGNFKAMMEQARLILNGGFARNPMFVPLTVEEFWFQAKEMMWIMDPHISLMTYIDERPAGVVVCIPDLNPLLTSIRSRFGWTAPFHYLAHRLRRRRAVVIYYSVLPEFHGLGANSLALHKLIERLRSRKYRSLGVTWIADSNIPSLRQMHKLEAKRLHRLHLFRKPL